MSTLLASGEPERILSPGLSGKRDQFKESTGQTALPLPSGEHGQHHQVPLALPSMAPSLVAGPGLGEVIPSEGKHCGRDSWATQWGAALRGVSVFPGVSREFPRTVAWFPATAHLLCGGCWKQLLVSCPQGWATQVEAGHCPLRWATLKACVLPRPQDQRSQQDVTRVSKHA